jgi:hypothetical protein
MTRLPVRAGGAVVGIALAVGMLSGCASGSGTGSGSTTGPSAAAAPQVVAAAYAKTVQAGSAKLTMSVRASGAGVPSGTTVSGTGEVDFADQNSEMSMQLPDGLGQMQIRYVGGIAYAKLPDRIAGMLGGDKTWISIDVDQLTQQQLGTTLSQLQSSLSSNPADMLGFLRGTGQDVRELGPATVGGVPTTHYAATIDLDKAVTGQSAQVRSAVHRAMDEIGTKDIPAQLWVDQQGRLRKLVMTMTIQLPAEASAAAGSAAPRGTLTERIVTTLSDYGVPVEVVAPPASQTQDLTGMLSDAH